MAGCLASKPQLADAMFAAGVSLTHHRVYSCNASQSPEAEGVGVGRTNTLAGEHTRVGTRRHDSNSNARAAVSLRAPT